MARIGARSAARWRLCFPPRQMPSFAPAMHRVAAAAVERLAPKREGRVLDVSEEMARITLEVLEQTLFSQGLGRDASEFQVAVSRYFDTIGRIDPLDLLGARSFCRGWGACAAASTLEFFARAVDDIVGAPQEPVSLGRKPAQRHSNLLLARRILKPARASATDDVRANIVTFIGAGHETTANALTWTLYCCRRRPIGASGSRRKSTRISIPANDADLRRLPTTKAVIEEALRLYPPAATLSREAIGPDVLVGRRIPAGAVVTVSPFVLHRHRTLWRDPDAFDPERFLGDNREAIDRYAYIPFGAGPRVCIGMGFAMLEAMAVLGHLLRAFRFDLAPGHAVVAGRAGDAAAGATA